METPRLMVFCAFNIFASAGMLPRALAWTSSSTRWNGSITVPFSETFNGWSCRATRLRESSTTWIQTEQWSWSCVLLTVGKSPQNVERYVIPESNGGRPIEQHGHWRSYSSTKVGIRMSWTWWKLNANWTFPRRQAWLAVLAQMEANQFESMWIRAALPVTMRVLLSVLHWGMFVFLRWVFA